MNSTRRGYLVWTASQMCRRWRLISSSPCGHVDDFGGDAAAAEAAGVDTVAVVVVEVVGEVALGAR
jgi:hypothetical protein